MSAHEVSDREEADAAAAVGSRVDAEVEVVVNAQALRVARDVHERPALPHAREELATPAHVVVLAILHDLVRAVRWRANNSNCIKGRVSICSRVIP